jgi:hypothetical protein
MPCPSGHLPESYFRNPIPGLQHPESAIWPRCDTSASDVERTGGSSYSQASNFNIISELLAVRSGSISERQCERLGETMRG